MASMSQKMLVFAVTFTSYGLYHSSRKAMSGVKGSMTQDWLSNTTHEPLFTNEAEAKQFLGTLDAVFMAAYSLALFFWGWLGDRLNPKYVVAAGMVGSALTLVLFGAVPKWVGLYSVPYYVFTYALFGLVQACGWPSEIAIMAAWWGAGNRGLTMGIWAACQPVGNIFGSILTGIVLPLGYENTYVVNSAFILLGAVVVLTSIRSRPSDSVEDDHRDEDDSPISLLRAILLPGVVMYCICNACLKLVNYAFFFWLPLYLSEAYKWDEGKADQLSIWYDIGGIVGSVAGGYISDRLGYRSPLLVGMLLSSLAALFLFSSAGPHMLTNVLLMTIVGITVSGPYNLIVGTVSIDLGSQPILAGNSQAMATVSGLLDGTGSVGSAIGQAIIPLVQAAFGWRAVFFLFIILNSVAVLSLSRRAYLDVKSISRRGRAEGAPLLYGDEDSHID